MVNVEKFVETKSKTMRKITKNFGKLLNIFIPNVKNYALTDFFQPKTTNFSSTPPPLSLSNIFHYSTKPTTTSTIYNKLAKERI